MAKDHRISRSFTQQLQATLVRNVRLKLRDSRKTMAEVFLPLYTIGTLILLKVFIRNPHFPAIVTPRGVTPLFEHFQPHDNHTVAILPASPNATVATRAFLDAVNDLWLNMSVYPAGQHDIDWQFYDTDDDLQAAYWRKPWAMRLAVVFHGEDPFGGQLSYEIRTNPTFNVTPPTAELFASPMVCRGGTGGGGGLVGGVSGVSVGGIAGAPAWASMLPIESGESCPGNQYYYSGFVALQALFDYTKIRIASSNLQLEVPLIQLEMFPKPAYTGNWMMAFRVVIPVYMVIALSQFITYLLILIVGEKENHIKEGLKIMGLLDSVYWLAWFLIYAAFVTFLSAVATLMMFSLSVFQYTHYLPVFVLILLYSLSVILIGFMITPFFDKSRTAGILGSFAVNIMSMLYFIQVFIDDTDTSVALWIVSLISPTGFALAMDKILVLDISQQGVTFDNLWSGPGIPLGGSILMMALDNVLYAALAFYFDSVVPSEHGTKQHPYFCLSRKYWCNRQPTAANLQASLGGPGTTKSQLLNGELAAVTAGDGLESGTGSANQLATDDLGCDVEPVSREMRGREAIRIVDLHKSFHSCRKPEMKAVNGVNLTIYEGQITAILGHNGAGKSTLFNLLTGLTAPTSGTAYIFGYDIRDPNDMMMIRRMTGVCPQHDILFDQLTPVEHLNFFAAIRGIHRSHIKAEVKRTLRDIDLHESADTISKNLSGGQKRKLSVGIAIIGDPKIIILDEPTAGVDPYSRRHMWSILQQLKPGKVILLTTHFMDEADILADRKAVISRGRLRCCGSSLFLKNKFGIGYHLTLVLDTHSSEAAITRLVNQHVPLAERARRHGRELSYILPHDAVEFFAPLFVDIEAEIAGRAQRMGICSYGVSMTTLEEVFLHLETEQREREDGELEGDEGEEPDDDNVPMDGLSKQMVRNRALSRSLSLQGKTGSYHSLQNDGEASNGEKGLGAGMEDCLMAVPAPRLQRHNSGHRDSHAKTTCPSGGWQDLEDIELRPNCVRTLAAMLKLRVVMLMRDLQRLYLMIVMPLAFTAAGLYFNSTQVIQPFVRSVVLDAGTYEAPVNSIAVLDNTHNPDSADFRYIVSQLNSSVTVSGGFNGNFSHLLDVAPHMGAVIVNGLSWSSVAVTAMYNDTTQHSLPIVMNLLSNALYRMNVDDYLPIEVRTHPFRPTTQPQEFNVGIFTTAAFVGMMFVLVPVSLAVDMVYDRETKTKNQLRVNGLPTVLYFATYFVILTALMVVICTALLGMVFLFDLPSFRQTPALLTVGALMFLYCPSAILCSTSFSYVFDRTDSAQSILPNILTFVGLIPFILVIILDMLGIAEQAAIALHCVLSLINPMYIPFASIYFVDRVYVSCRLSNACDQLSLANYMTHEVIVMALGCVLHIPMWALVLRVCDVRSTGGKVRDALGLPIKMKHHHKHDPDEYNSSDGEATPGEFEDADVRLERARVQRMVPGVPPPTTRPRHQTTNGGLIHGGHETTHPHSATNPATPSMAATVPPVVLVRNLRKEYHRKDNCCTSNCCCCIAPVDSPARQPKVAVRSLSLAIDAGEVMGLLGHNGAGKTTTMQIMTGETAPTRGQVHIGGYNVEHDRRRAFQTMGYCPQHDALWKTVTVREHIELYAAIRGVPRRDLSRVCDTYLRGLHIEEHAGKQTQHCSGGTRRKLSYAMAMVGAPKVVLLDEPSTGMDPKSKRFLWDTILASFQGTRGAVLTTHSMEEADALCSRVGIMVKGELRCLGSTQHLKNLYGAGYTLEVKLRHIESHVNSARVTESPGVVRPASTSSSQNHVQHSDPLRSVVVVPPPPTDDGTMSTVGAASISVESVASSCPLNGRQRSRHQPDGPSTPQLPQPTSFDVACEEQEQRSALLRQFVGDLFPDACLEESFADRLVYSVPQEAVSSLAECFNKLEGAKAALNIEEYSFSQTTLEQVFLKFGHYDEEDEEGAAGQST